MSTIKESLEFKQVQGRTLTCDCHPEVLRKHNLFLCENLSLQTLDIYTSHTPKHQGKISHWGESVSDM